MFKHSSIFSRSVLTALSAATPLLLHAGGPAAPAFASNDKSPILSGQAADAGASSGPRWRAGLGAQWRTLNSMSLRATPRFSLSSSESFMRAPSGSRSGDGHAGGPADRAASRVYKDGFVFADEGTAVDGTTWWWGYEDAAQVQGDSLMLHAEADYPEAFSSSRSGAYDESFENEGGTGPVLELGADWQIQPGLLAGADFTFSFMEADVAGGGTLFTGRRESFVRRATLSDTYALQGVVPPHAPYAGSRGGPGPVIDNIPSRRDRREHVTEPRETTLQSAADLSLSLDVYNLSLGPSFTWERGRFSLRGTAALELDIVSWELESRETLRVRESKGKSRRLASLRDSASGTDLLTGLGLSTRAAWRFTDCVEVAAFGKWRVMDTLDMEAGKTGARLDPGGWTAGVTLGVRF